MKTAFSLNRSVRRGLLYIPLIIVAAFVLYPVWSAIDISFLTDKQVGSYPPRLVPSRFQFQNYVRAFQQAPLPRYLLNSIVQSAIVMTGQLLTASLAAYAFSILDFKGKRLLFLLFLSTMMIPWEATIIPNYLTIRRFHWNDSFLGLTVPFLATAFGTFLIRQFMLTIPKDFHDAARIDGCGNLRFLLQIVLPLTRPALGTLAVYAFLQTYNQYLWPLLITNNEMMRTVQVGIALLQDEERFMFNTVMAGVVVVVIPTALLFVLGNRQLIRGLTAGGIKG